MEKQRTYFHFTYFLYLTYFHFTYFLYLLFSLYLLLVPTYFHFTYFLYLFYYFTEYFGQHTLPSPLLWQRLFTSTGVDNGMITSVNKHPGVTISSLVDKSISLSTSIPTLSPPTDWNLFLHDECICQ